MPSSSSSSTALWWHLLVVLLTAMLTNADVCQCGARCSAYKREHHCTRCCASMMRRRSVPFLDYPREQIDVLRESAKVEADAPLSEHLLTKIVEQTATQQQHALTRPRHVRVVEPVDAVEVVASRQKARAQRHHQKGAMAASSSFRQRKQVQQRRTREQRGQQQQMTQLWRRVLLSNRKRRNNIKSLTSFD